MKPFLFAIASTAILSLLSIPSLAQSGPVAVPTETKPTSDPVTEIPIHLVRNYLVVVEGTIGNSKKLNFAVDTGAYPSVIDQSVVAALGLRERNGKLALLNKNVQAKLAILPPVEVGAVHVDNLPVLVQDLSSISKTFGQRIDAVIGLDILGTTSFTIDYKAKRLRFGPVEHGRTMVSFENRSHFLVVEARLDGQPVRLMVDTGASALMLFQSRIRGPISLVAERSGIATNLGGDFQRQRLMVRDLRIGKERIGPLIGFVVADQKDDGRDFDGLLSVRGLHIEKVGFDLENHKISWSK